jgi:hypothetical protein
MPDMGDVGRLLSENLLEGAAARAFHKQRAGVARRHANWRENFPAVGLLLDSDEERAQALAGNLATEAREIVGVWLSAQESAPPSDTGIEERVAWVEGFWSAWRADAFDAADLAVLEEGPRRRFTTIFDDLMERFRDDAVAFVRDGGAQGSKPRPILGRATAPLRALARAIESFFFPSVRR